MAERGGDMEIPKNCWECDNSGCMALCGSRMCKYSKEIFEMQYAELAKKYSNVMKERGDKHEQEDMP